MTSKAMTTQQGAGEPGRQLSLLRNEQYIVTSIIRHQASINPSSTS